MRAFNLENLNLLAVAWISMTRSSYGHVARPVRQKPFLYFTSNNCGSHYQVLSNQLYMHISDYVASYISIRHPSRQLLCRYQFN